jgi:hypothetical protein
MNADGHRQYRWLKTACADRTGHYVVPIKNIKTGFKFSITTT